MADNSSSSSWWPSTGNTDTNVPVTAGSNSVVSPYLSFDPAYVNPTTEPQFIFPEGASAQRGRFELAFSQIGFSVLGGGLVGGVNGLRMGVKETTTAQLTGSIRKTQLLNFVTKQGASTAQSLGVLAVMYSVFGVVISKARGADDELNTLAAGTGTGLLFKCTAGAPKCLRAGAVGFGLAAVYSIATSKDRIKQMLGMR